MSYESLSITMMILFICYIIGGRLKDTQCYVIRIYASTAMCYLSFLIENTFTIMCWSISLIFCMTALCLALLKKRIKGNDE